MLGPFCIWLYLFLFPSSLFISYLLSVSPSISSLAPDLFPLSHFFLPMPNLSFSFLSLSYPLSTHPQSISFFSFLTFPLFLAHCHLPPALPFLLTLPHPSHSSSPPPSFLLLFLLAPASYTASHLQFCILWDQILTSLRCSAKEINFAYSDCFDVIDREFSRWHRNTLNQIIH